MLVLSYPKVSSPSTESVPSASAVAVDQTIRSDETIRPQSAWPSFDSNAPTCPLAATQYKGSRGRLQKLGMIISVPAERAELREWSPLGRRAEVGGRWCVRSRSRAVGVAVVALSSSRSVSSVTIFVGPVCWPVGHTTRTPVQ